MLIVCNRPSGFILPGLPIKPGENIVDDDLWREVEAKLNPVWLNALLTPQGLAMPELILCDDAGEPEAEPEAEAPQFSAKDKIALIDACESIDDLAQYETGETRKTVLVAIERRMRVLIEHEHVPGFEGV